MTSSTRTALLPSRSLISVVVITALAATVLIADTAPGHANDLATPVVGSFGIGDNIAGQIDERTGVFETQFSVASVAGVSGSPVDMQVAYRQELATAGVDRFGLGNGWVWSESFIDVDGGVRVFPASGGVFDADASQPSGLDQYVLGDVVFRHQQGALPTHTVTSKGIKYEFSLAYRGGITDYFNDTGDLVARVDVFGSQTNWVWEGSHRLVEVVDNTGLHVNVVWGEENISVVGPQRSDGVSAVTELEVTGSRLVSVTNLIQERVRFEYQDAGLLHYVWSSSGAVAELSYQHLPDARMAVKQVRVKDGETGKQLSVREWVIIGDRTASGWPTYGSQGALWGSGDSEFRYQTQLSDGATRVVSEYNSMGLMIARNMLVSTSAGDVVMHEQKRVFPGTENGGVPTPQVLPKNYQKPIKTELVFHDSRGRTRTVSEDTTFDETGRITKHVSTDGRITETVYDTEIPHGMVLPVGVVLEQTTTSTDGLVSKTVNTPTTDRKTIATTETFTGTAPNELTSTSRTMMTVEPTGFVSQEIKAAVDPHTGSTTELVSTWNEVVNLNARTVTLSETIAAGTDVAQTVSTVVDAITGHPVTQTDVMGRVTTTEYDSAGRPLTQTDPAGRVTQIEYLLPNVTATTRPNGTVSQEYRDVIGRVVKLTDNIKNGTAVPGYERLVETRSYENNDAVVVVTDAWGATTMTRQDVFGRVVETVAPNGARHVTDYDDVANTVSSGVLVGTTSTLKNADMISTQHRDVQGRVVQQTGTREDGVPVPAASNIFDGFGRAVESTLNGVKSSIAFDAYGNPEQTRVTSIENITDAPTTAVRKHNAFGESLKKDLVRADGQTQEGISRVVDVLGRTVSETNQAGNTTAYTYTADGLVETVTEPSGVVTRNTYDTATRNLIVSEKSSPTGDENLATGYDYDPVTDAVVGVFDPRDKNSTTVQYTYDMLGNTTRVLYPDGKNVSHTFDAHGRQTSTTDIIGNTTSYEYDNAGLMIRAVQTNTFAEPIGAIQYVYDQKGRIKKLSRSTGSTTTYTFTAVNEIASETTTNERGETITAAKYTYDPNGNITQRIDTRTLVGKESLETQTTTYTYDGYARLVTSTIHNGETRDDPVTQKTTYTHTVAGDIETETIMHDPGTDLRHSAH